MKHYSNVMKSSFDLLKLVAVFVKFVFVLFVLSFFTTLNAQTPVYRSIGEAEGLPSLTIYRLLQDAQQYIWVATQDGLYRYDGKDFDLYRHPEQKDNEILKLEEDRYGRIWFSNLAGQVFYCQDDQVYLFYEQTVEQTAPYLDFAVSHSSIYFIYVFGDNNPDSTMIEEVNLKTLDLQNSKKRMHHGRILRGVFETNEANAFYLLHEEKNENGLVTYSRSIDKRVRDSLYVFRYKQRLGFGALTIDKDEILLYAKKGKAYYTIKEGKAQKEFFIDRTIRNAKFIDDSLFFLCNEGVVVVDKKNGGKQGEAFLSAYQINDLLKDREGNYWLATNGDGILIIPSLEFSLVDETRNNIVYSLGYNQKTQEVYTGHGAQQISIFDKDTHKIRKQKQINTRGGRIVDIVFHPALGLILASDKGLYAENIDLNSLIQAQGAHAATGAIKKIMLSTDNKLWVGTYGLVLYVDLNKIGQTYKEEEILFKRTYGLCEDTQGTIWIGTTSGLYTYKNENTRLFSLAKALGQEPIVSDIALARDSSIWVTTNNMGILQIKNEQVLAHYNMSSNDALLSNDFRSVFVDQNDLWFASNKGLYQLDAQLKEWQLINTSDGLPSDDVLKVMVKEQSVWLSTIKGLLTFSKRALKKNTIAPPVYIIGLNINNRDTVLQENAYELAYDQNSIYIDFEGLAYRNKGDLAYEYRLIGLQEAWQKTENRFVRYHALEGGKYSFELRAVNEDGVKSKEPARLILNIKAPWWESTWFSLLLLLFVVLAVYAFIRRRIQRIKEQQHYQNKINEVTMLALQSQMNPHFIFNALNAIQSFLTSKDEEHAMIYLARFAQLIRLAFEYSKEKLISLEDEIAFLKLYLSLESLRFNNTVDVNWEVSQEVQEHLDVYKISPLLIQPVIENAFKHGLFHKKGDKKLFIKLECKEGFLSCIIRDNGVGRQKVEQINQWKVGKHRSLGLKTTQERLLLFNEGVVDKAKFEKYMEIKDIFDEENRAVGTSVELLFKLERIQQNRNFLSTE